MRRMSFFDAPGRQTAPRLALLGAPLLLALAAGLVAPAPAAAQLEPMPRATLEGYVARAQLDPAVAGARAQLDAVGARLLVPVGHLTAAAPRWLGERVSLGGFITSAATGERGVAARHYGVQADLGLTERPLAGRVEPLASLGVGGFRTRHEPRAPQLLGTACFRSIDVSAVAGGGRCVPLRRDDLAEHRHALALSPALGARIALLPGLALRVDARDVIVYGGGPRHNPELALGLSFTR